MTFCLIMLVFAVFLFIVELRNIKEKKKKRAMDKSTLPPAQILIHFSEKAMGIHRGRARKIIAHLVNSGLEWEQ